MSQAEREPSVKRILVALDTSKHSLAALAAAVELAAHLDAELLGLFVEDINLLRLAGLPFAQEIYPSAVTRQMDSARLEYELRLQAAQARRALAEAAELLRVPWSFRVARGQVAAEVLAAAMEADLLSLGIASRPLLRRTRPGSTALAMAAKAPRAVLLLQHGERLGQPVLVTYDGSTAAKRGLEMAARLVQTVKPEARQPLIVLIVTETDSVEVAQRLEHEATAELLGQFAQVNFRRLPQADLASLVESVKAEKGGVLVLGGESPLLEADTIQALLDRIACPVLLVR
jgi:nucleotide-binding universal stress UspA family protein